jgi:hypothetical protein
MFYVVANEDDPGSCHETYNEARELCVWLQKNGYPNAFILW